MTQSDHPHPRPYQLRVAGKLNAQWSEWFEGFTITPAQNGETLITGWVADQAALHGLLKKLRDLGLPLLALNPLDLASPGDPNATRDPIQKE